MNPLFPQRKTLPHGVPHWVPSGSLYFLTLCCTPRRQNQLCTPLIAAAIFESVRFRHERHDWFARLILLMPDHLHALVTFPVDQPMSQAIRLWKGYLARHHGIAWQRDFFDHRIRSGESWEEKAHYIRQNPVRAGLAAKADEWPYVWEPLA